MKQMQRVISVLFVSFVSFCARGAKIHSEAISESSIATSENAGGTSGFQLPPAGSYIAIRGLKEGRWLKIEGCQVEHSWGGNDNLADEARAERFKLVGTGSGTHALHNTEWSRYLIMKGGSLQVSEVLSEFEWARLPAGGLFTLQGTENGHAIWSAHNERFIINEGGIKVGPVEARTAAFGTGASTGGSGTGGTGVRKYDFRILQQTYTRPCPSLHTSHGASCKAYIIGKTIGLYNPYHERYIRVKEGGWADASAVIPRHTFPGWEYLFAPSLPNGWTWERFEVVDAGNGNIALHNIEHNRFLAMDAQGFIRAGGLRDAGEPNCDASGGEHFTLVGDLVAYGDQNVALYNPHFQHFVKMDDSAQLVVLGPLGSDQLQSSNTWEKFLVQEESYQKDDCPYLYFPKGASCKPWLIFQKVSFYNPWHQRFMKMINTDSADLVTTHQQGADDLCDSCDDERFRVVDVGMGMLGLYNEKFGRYVQMTDTQKMRSTHVMAKADLQGAWQWEKFQVVDLGNGKIGLHSGYFNRFVAMDYQTVIATAQHYNWNSPPTGDWPRFTVTYSGYGDHWTPEPWESFTDQSCKGSPYTYDECGGNCNGWSQITQAECQEKCENDDMPAGCQQDQTCMGAVYYPSNGWCHLYSICPETESYVGAVAIRRKVSPFNFLEVHSTVTKQIALRGEMAEKDDLEKLQELAVSLPIALVNLTNYSGLISSGKNMTHLDIAYRFGNYSKDLELLYDKTAGFYGALHEVMGEDANKYCPLKDWTHIEQCIRIASCLIEPAVEAGKLPIAFLVAIMEQLASFDIIWNMLTEALIKESNINQTAPGQFLPPKYVCDMFEKLDATSLAVPSMIQENQEKKEMDTAAVRSAFSTSAALNKATRESHQILSSLTSSDNVSYSVVKRWAETWYPVCVRMKCDHTNYWDIVLASYKQTLLFMKSGALSHLKAEIINRATSQRRFQSHLSEHPVLVQLWRREAQASSLEAAHAYGLAGNKAVKRVLKKFLESPGGLAKMMKLVDRVEFEKWQRTKAEADAEAHGEATPLRQVSNQSAHLALLSTRSEGVWDFFVNMVSCFGKWSLWYTQGYYKNLGSYGSVSFGMITGTTGAFESLVKELVPPQAFVSVWAAIGVGLTISGGKLPSVWVGLSASLSASLGCANNNYAVQVAISVGTMAAGVMPLPSHPMCPMGGWWHGIQCFHAIGGTFTLLCCKFDLASGNNNCR